MGTSDGYVSGLVKVHDSGSPADRFNLVFVAEGYQVSEIAQFQTDVDDAIANFFGTAPFDEDVVACAINIYRLEVVSNESGADNPMCADGGGMTLQPIHILMRPSALMARFNAWWLVIVV